jgi:hypothetical protein
MGRIRFLASAATLTLSLLLVAAEARAISLPDSSSCSTSSGAPCLTITNTDTGGTGIKAVGGEYGEGLQANGFVAIQATGDYEGVTGSGGFIGVNGSSYNWGVYGSSPGSTGSGVYGYASGGGYGVTAYSVDYGVGLQATGFVAIQAHGTYDGVSVTAGNTGVYGSAPNIGVYGSSSGSGYAVYGNNSNSSGYAGYFNGKVYASAGYTSSDARLKKDVAGLTYGLKDLAALRPVTFKWKDQDRGDGRYIGFLAQDLQKVVPEVVDQDTKSGMLAVNYPALVPVLVKSIQEQQAIIARQEARIAGLEQRPIVSSMFSGGINAFVALGALAALALNVVRRRKQRAS